MTFGVDPDTHIDTTEQAKASTIEGTSKWSCKLSITGRRKKPNLFTFHYYFYLLFKFFYSLLDLEEKK